jgi:hypothetical protein
MLTRNLKHNFTYSFIFFLLILVFNISIAQNASDFYFPLRVGNFWKYYTPGNSGGWGARTVIESIEGTDIIDGKLYFRLKGIEIMDSNPSDSTIFHVLWIRKDSAGNILLGAFGESTDIDSAFIFNPEYPLFPNEFLNVGYSREFFQSNRGIYVQDSVVSVTETVNVPAGTFTNCLKIRDRHKDTSGTITFVEYHYYARGIGEVMTVREIPTYQVHTNYLIEYNATTKVEEFIVDNVPEKIVLYQNYPNPFNPMTVIRFSLPRRENVTLEVFDVLGRDVAMLVNEQMDAGEHSVIFDASGLTSGVYFYRLQAGKFVSLKKMVLIR